MGQAAIDHSSTGQIGNSDTTLSTTLMISLGRHHDISDFNPSQSFSIGCTQTDDPEFKKKDYC